LDGPLGLVCAGYIGHLFARQFALAGYEVRAWSPARSVHTLHDRLRQSVSTLAEIGLRPEQQEDVAFVGPLAPPAIRDLPVHVPAWTS
jgi:3-hydroxyacyl-CoA dehydrogenase